ncbi:unnamed protein product, partial [Closterium sp. NIES-54]
KGKGGRGGGGGSGGGGGAAVGAVAAVEVVAAVGVVEGVGALVAAVEAAVGVAVVAAVAVVAVGLELSMVDLKEASGSGSSVGARPLRPSSFVSGCFSVGHLGRPHWAELLRSRVAIFDLDFDAILSAMYVLSANAEGDYYRCVPPDPGIDAAALGASESVLPGQVAPPCSCRLLSHQTLQWHHRLGHPSLPRLRGMHSRLFVSGLPRSLPPLPPLPAPPCLPCVKGRQRAAPHSSLFPSTTAPLQTLHMDVWGPACLRERFRADLPVLRLHSDKGGEFSSDLLHDVCRGEGILQSFTLPDTPKKNGIAERRIGLVMEVARTSMIHAAAPHFLWPFAVRYAAHQLNLWPRVSFPETSPTLHWTGKVGDASVFRVWGSRAFVCDTSADKLSTRATRCVFLGFTLDAPGWQFYQPTSRRVFPSQDVTFDETVPFYRLFPYRSAPPPPPPLFLAPGPPPVDPLPPQGPAPSGVSRVDPLPRTAPVEVAVSSGAARGAASGGVEPGVAESDGAGSGGAERGGEEPWGAEPEGVEPGVAESEGVEFGGAEPQGGASSRGAAGASTRLSLQQLREWLVRRARLRSGATGGGGAGDGGAGVNAGAGCTGGTAATGLGGARTRGTGAAGTDGVGGAGAGDPTKPGAAGAGGFGAGGTGSGGVGAGDTSAGGARAGGARVGGTGAGGARA